MDEKRRHPRVSAAMDIVYYTDGDDTPAQERIHYFGTITDLSRGGARLAVDQLHRPEERIWLQGVRGEADVVVGRVRWIATAEERYNVGVEFLNAV